jgi:xylan 1,4-beta-xylosidase
MSMQTIQNPILRGFYPDPSILRVGEDYYIATSTFEWFPGVPVHHSRDLIHWRLIGHILTRPSQLDLRGIGDSAGIWAPSLSFDNGVFYLIYTVVRTRIGAFKDVHNYLVTAPRLGGPWSEPIYLNSSGFDPSLFHDDDGRKWLVNMQWDFRKNHPRFAGIVLQEYSAEKKQLIGQARTILSKTHLIEGPNLYKHNGYYYLMLAEGGTGWNHGISMARSRAIGGPYELDPQPLLLTSRQNPGLLLQKAGHGELVCTPTGEWYLIHLASRPVYPDRRCILGRETCLQKVTWSDDGWLGLESGGTDPQAVVAAPAGVQPHPWPVESERDDFTDSTLSPHWQSLRIPIDDSWATLTARPGWLRLSGRESCFSLFEQSLLAKRLRSFRCSAETHLEFSPNHFTQSAGLVCWYDTRTFYYLAVTHDEQRGKVLGIELCDDGQYDQLLDSYLAIGDWSNCFLRASIDYQTLQFSASPDGRNWKPIGPVLDATKLSDDYGTGFHFTGAFAGLCARDLNGRRIAADFDYFELKDLDHGD